MPEPVHLPGFAQLLRDLQEHLTKQERAERGGEERHRQALVRVQPTEAVDRAPVDDQRDLERNQQRGEEHPEEQVLQRKPRNAKA